MADRIDRVVRYGSSAPPTHGTIWGHTQHAKKGEADCDSCARAVVVRAQMDAIIAERGTQRIGTSALRSWAEFSHGKNAPTQWSA